MKPKRLLSYNAEYLDNRDVDNARIMINTKCEELANKLYDLNIDMFDACFSVDTYFRLAAMRNIVKYRNEREKQQT